MRLAELPAPDAIPPKTAKNHHSATLLRRPEYEESLRIAAGYRARTRDIGHRIVGTSHLIGTEKLIAIRPGENHLVLFGIDRESDERAIQRHNFSTGFSPGAVISRWITGGVYKGHRLNPRGGILVGAVDIKLVTPRRLRRAFPVIDI